MYRRVNRVVVELLWLELIWLIDWWGGVKVFSNCGVFFFISYFVILSELAFYG